MLSQIVTKININDTQISPTALSSLVVRVNKTSLPAFRDQFKIDTARMIYSAPSSIV